MSYEDVARIADLKTRDTRFARVHQESRAQASQLVQIKEFLHPGVEEISRHAAGIARSLAVEQRLDEKMDRAFYPQGSHCAHNFALGIPAALWVGCPAALAAQVFAICRRAQRICAWLEQIPVLAQENYALAVELAECPHIVKGYGETQARGRKNFDALMAALPKLADGPTPPDI